PKLAHDFAHKYYIGKRFATGGGGYDIWSVVLRAWAQEWIVMKNNKQMTGELTQLYIKKWQNKADENLTNYWYDIHENLPVIPREKEINEKNEKTLLNALKYIKSSQNG